MLSISPQIVARRIFDPPTRVVALSGEHDLSTAKDLEQALTSAVASGDAVIVDLRRVTFADSSVHCVILDAHARAGRGAFAVVLPPFGAVARLFELLDARAVLVTFPTLRPAIDWCHPTRRAQAEPRRLGPWAQEEV